MVATLGPKHKVNVRYTYIEIALAINAKFTPYPFDFACTFAWCC